MQNGTILRAAERFRDAAVLSRAQELAPQNGEQRAHEPTAPGGEAPAPEPNALALAQ